MRVGYHTRRDGSYGPRHTKFFGDVSYGGKRRSLKAAEKFLGTLKTAPKKTARKRVAKPKRTARARTARKGAARRKR